MPRDSLRVPAAHPVLAALDRAPTGALLGCIREQLTLLGMGHEAQAVLDDDHDQRDVRCVLGRVVATMHALDRAGARAWWEIARDCAEHLRALEDRMRGRGVPDITQDEHERLSAL